MASYGSQQYQQQQQQQQQQQYQQQQQQQVPLSPGAVNWPGQTQLLLQSPKKPGLLPESSVVQPPPPPPPVPLNMEGKTLGRRPRKVSTEIGINAYVRKPIGRRPRILAELLL